MANERITLGAQLRQLIELLDSAVEASYAASGLRYRPRFTPIVRELMASGEGSLRTIALRTGLSHSAISQTVAQMARMNLVQLRSGADARERVVRLSPEAIGILPALHRRWDVTNHAANTLGEELSAPLSSILEQAIAALSAEPFADRLKRAELELARHLRSSEPPHPAPGEST